jgi:hypothetical protein
VTLFTFRPAEVRMSAFAPLGRIVLLSTLGGFHMDDRTMTTETSSLLLSVEQLAGARDRGADRGTMTDNDGSDR